MQSRNPHTGEIRGYPAHSLAEAQQLVRVAADAQRIWRTTPFEHRAALLRKAAALLLERKAQYALRIAEEMGKPITQGIAEIEKCALVCEYYAAHAAQMLTPEMAKTDATKSYVRYDPLGVILAVMPWNFPFWQVIRFAAPALMAGNTGVLKHASNVPGCALAIQAVFHDAGFPKGAFTTLLIPPTDTEPLIAMPEIAAVTLTGSEHAGKSVAAAAGKSLKKAVLELGGSDPFIVLPDADIALAAAGGRLGRLQNAGQSCIAAKRFIIHSSVLSSFTEALKAEFTALKSGDPGSPETQIGPLAREDLAIALDAQVQQSLSKGARLVLGGTRNGCHYAPTILMDCKPGMAVYDEETFGPVAAIIPFETEEEAVRIANSSPYGLGATIWTRDTAKAEELAAQIETGSVFINSIVKSDPRLPFGGVKLSGYGRELAQYGIREFVNAKTVWVK